MSSLANFSGVDEFEIELFTLGCTFEFHSLGKADFLCARLMVIEQMSVVNRRLGGFM